MMSIGDAIGLEESRDLRCNGAMSDCKNIIPSTGKVCGADADSPFHQRFCSDECADRVNQRELEELGITPDLMKEALQGYYECKDMIEQREAEGSRTFPLERGSRSPYSSDQE
jgi:hypothetical protein